MLVRGIVASGCWAASKPSGPIGRCPLGGRGGGGCRVVVSDRDIVREKYIVQSLIPAFHS